MKDTLKPGEKFFSIFFLIISLWAFVESLKMFINAPSASSYGALPMITSGIMVLCMLKVIFIEDLRKKSINHVGSFSEKVRLAAKYILSWDVLLFIVLIIAYTVLLFIGAGFILSSAVFMLSCMFYLMPRDKKNMITNVVTTIALLGFLYLAFKVAFRIVLP